MGTERGTPPKRARGARATGGAALLLAAIAFGSARPARAQAAESAGARASMARDTAWRLDSASDVFAAVGLVVGMPSGVGLTAGLWRGPLMARLSGGASGPASTGLQGEIGYRLWRGPRWSMDVAAVAGTFETQESINAGAETVPVHQSYLGLALGLQYDGFTAQLGLAHGFAAFPPNQQLLLQVGYSWIIPLGGRGAGARR